MPTHTTVNGIRALWVDGPPPFTAALMVHAGATHESVRTNGVAHLVEHLVMGAQPRTALDVNASVDEVTTVFHATGDRDEVLAWLARVCATIADVPHDRLAVEAKVLDAEDGAAVHPAIGFSAAARFGAEGVGLLGRQGAPHGSLTSEHVRDFVDRHYRRDSAVLVFTGEPPADLDIHLPEGQGADRPPALLGPLELPAYLTGPPIPVVSWLVRRSPAAPVLMALVCDLLIETLRHQEGIVYDVDSGSTPVSRDEGLAVIWADGAEKDQPRILGDAVGVLRRLADDGPDPEELVHQKALARTQMTDPRGAVDHLLFCAYRLLEDKPVLSLEEDVAELQSVTGDDIRGAAAHALETLVLAGSQPADEGIAGIPDRTDDDVPDCPQVDGRTWKRKLVSTAPRDLRIVLGDDGLAQTVYGHRHGGRWEELVGVAHGPDFRALVFRDGIQVVVWPSSFGDGRALAAEIDRRAGELAFEVDEDWL